MSGPLKGQSVNWSVGHSRGEWRGQWLPAAPKLQSDMWPQAKWLWKGCWSLPSIYVNCSVGWLRQKVSKQRVTYYFFLPGTMVLVSLVLWCLSCGHRKVGMVLLAASSAWSDRNGTVTHSVGHCREWWISRAPYEPIKDIGLLCWI